jgi:hypothetical protein
VSRWDSISISGEEVRNGRLERLLRAARGLKLQMDVWPDRHSGRDAVILYVRSDRDGQPLADGIAAWQFAFGDEVSWDEVIEAFVPSTWPGGNG